MMRVLLPIDGSEASRSTLYWATEFLNKKKAKIFLITVVYYTPEALVTDEEITEAYRIINEAKTFLQNRGFQIEKAEYVLGTPSKAICEYADQNVIEQIIMGAHGHRRLSQRLLGSVSQGVFKCAKQPVLLLNNVPRPSLEISHPEQLKFGEQLTSPVKILLPVDGSHGAQRTLAWAAMFLDKDKPRIYLLNVYHTRLMERRVQAPDLKSSRRILDQAKTFLSNAGFQIEQTESIEGSPGQTICEYADEQGIHQIIIGSHGHQGIDSFLLGSVSQEVFKCANQPVLLLNNTAEPFLKISHPEEIPLSQKEPS